MLFTPEKRTEIADQVLSLVAQDERIEAALTVGSMATEPDRWSDIDLAIAVADHVDHVVVAHDWVVRLYEELPILHHFETAFGDSLVRGFLLEDLLELDLSFTPRAEFSVWGPAQVAFDRSGELAVDQSP
ncbi:MAG TPA: aminoglycoside 6-adenylyltransferase, partial [Actinomycetota bacterium]|nr:aminoglycoside 6-adenylyltransferase [Actinomycetota bacterium]